MEEELLAIEIADCKVRENDGNKLWLSCRCARRLITVKEGQLKTILPTLFRLQISCVVPPLCLVVGMVVQIPRKPEAERLRDLGDRTCRGGQRRRLRLQKARGACNEED